VPGDQNSSELWQFAGKLVPPNASQNASYKVCQDVPGVGHCPRDDSRTQDLEKDRPNCQIKRDLSQFREPVVGAQAQSSLNQKQWGQRTWDQEQVIEMIVEESAVEVRLEYPAIQRIEQTRKQK